MPCNIKINITPGLFEQFDLYYVFSDTKAI